MKFDPIGFFKNYTNSLKIKSTVNSDLINDAYKKRSKEISSLRDHDSGKKEIDAPNFNNIMQGLQGSN